MRRLVTACIAVPVVAAALTEALIDESLAALGAVAVAVSRRRESFDADPLAEPLVELDDWSVR